MFTEDGAMQRARWFAIVAVSAMLVCAAARAEEASVLLEAGVYAEEVVGDLDKAIETYEKVIADAEANRRCVAEAHYRLGTCYLRKGEEEAAVEHFRTVLRDFSDQKATAERAVQAWARMLPRSNAPLVLYTSPQVFANDVSPSVSQITVIFDRPMMDGSWSWTGGGETFPQTVGKPHYDATRMVCTLPVKLAPGKVYWIGVNSPSHHFFQTPNRVPARPYVVLFATEDRAGSPTPIPEEMRQKAEAINDLSVPPSSGQSPVEPSLNLARLAELRIRLGEAKAEVAAKEAGFDVLQRALERTTMMHEVGQTDAASLDRARLELTRARVELEAASQKVEILIAEIARLAGRDSGPVQTARDFLQAVAAGDYDRALGLSERDKIRASGLGALRTRADLLKAQIAVVWATEENACAVTSFFTTEAREGRRSQAALGIGLERQGDRWLVADIDALPDTEKAAAFLRDFRKHFPDARQLLSAQSAGNPVKP